MTKTVLMLVLLAGCGDMCRETEVLCAWSGEARCVFACHGSAWVEVECVPACGPGLEAFGEDGSYCRVPAAVCR